MYQTEQDTELLEKSLKSKVYTLMLYNDDVNTFDHVIESLKEICGHTQEQAEQCTLLVHYKGKCDVKRGSLKSLKPMFAALCDRSLSAAIEK
ncbi:MAG TPA: ATP-dependent Clp protease adaptor ClpS [Bacteroidia bacterium]|jgi:ATP-dependent Clp protease adaptor protein ClpS|nr:ATP-dependent Clp protease adaptor ClpS [Bacteroidia bacterium]